jgi:hypothetical protein
VGSEEKAFNLVQENLLLVSVSREVLIRLTGFTDIKQTGACTDDETGLVKAGDTGSVVIRLPIRQMCANVRQIDHCGQTGVPRTHLERTNLLRPLESQQPNTIRGGGELVRTSYTGML